MNSSNFRNNMPFAYNPYSQQSPPSFNDGASIRIQLDVANNRIRDLEDQLAASNAELQIWRDAEAEVKRKRLHEALLKRDWLQSAWLLSLALLDMSKNWCTQFHLLVLCENFAHNTECFYILTGVLILHVFANTLFLSNSCFGDNGCIAPQSRSQTLEWAS